MTYPVRGTVKDGEKVLLEGVDTWVDFVDSLTLFFDGELLPWQEVGMLPLIKILIVVKS